MHHSKASHDKIIHRLKISLGHLKKVLTMVETHAYCIDTIHQSQAVQKALRETDQIILENHLRTCVIDKIRKGKEKEAVAEIMSVIVKAK